MPLVASQGRGDEEHQRTKKEHKDQVRASKAAKENCYEQGNSEATDWMEWDLQVGICKLPCIDVSRAHFQARAERDMHVEFLK